MCIVFLQLVKRGQKPAPKYWLILAANRDEYFHRPSKSAAFWEDAPHVLGGRDLTQGREGGTWLGMTTQGRFGTLTNFRSRKDFDSIQNQDKNIKSRGPIVMNYLKGDMKPEDYTNMLLNCEEKYSPFNVLLGDFVQDSGFQFYYGSNRASRIEESLPLEPGIHGLSNAELNCSWTKVQKGKKAFEDIVKSNFEKETLIEELLKLMQNSERNYPDHGGSDMFLKKEHVAPLSSIYVSAPEVMYGTRSIAVILVDDKNCVTFVEKAMTDPMNLSNPSWQTKRFEFMINTV